jgi:hypothetical protein
MVIKQEVTLLSARLTFLRMASQEANNLFDKQGAPP